MTLKKTFDPSEVEARIYAEWQQTGAFKAGVNAAADASTYAIMIPPPNVTGSLHMGHAFNNTLQDILVRWHRMRGFDTLWQPGTDHAGIATQMVTEREMEKNGEPSRIQMGRKAFERRVWQQKIESREQIVGQLKRLGASCDWSREAFTMSGAETAPAGEEGNFHDAVIKVFVEMYRKGLIYRGKRLVNWDPKFATAISDLEVENIEIAGNMWHFKYRLEGGATYSYVERDEHGQICFEEERDYIAIATTRPETMLGDGAVAVHPTDERYAPIVGKFCEIPVGPRAYRRLIPIITDEYPDPNFGSGAVKITGAHDFNDYQVARRNKIPCYRLMDNFGAMRSDGVPYAEAANITQQVAREERKLNDVEIDGLNLVPDDLRGSDRFEARTQIVQQIIADNLAVMTTATDPRLGSMDQKAASDNSESFVPLIEAKTITQPFGDRSKVVIEPMLTDQWFVDTAKIVDLALDAVRSGAVSVVPESGEKTYFHWLENIEPWCISRQLWWGHQIPIWYGPQVVAGSDAPLPQRFSIDPAHCPSTSDDLYDHCCHASEQEAVAEFQARFGVNVVVVPDEDAFRAAMLEFAQGKRDTVPIFRDPDVLDTWFSSGLWPIGTLGWPAQTPELQRYFPTSVLITGQDILFFWVARMIMMQLAVVGEVPFRQVYLHGLVRDANGRKMSKSLGNVVDPLSVIDEFGADALRLTSAAMASLGGMLKLDRGRFAGYRNFITKLWNFARFAEMYGVFDAEAPALPAPNHTLNRWIVGETAKTLERVNSALEDFRFDDLARILHAFIWGTVCDWYVEFSKPLLQDVDNEAGPETRTTMKWVLDQCLTLLHPLAPFVTEELWRLSGNRRNLLMLSNWPSYKSNDLLEAAADHEMNWVINLIENIRSARAQVSVPAAARIPILAVEMDSRAQSIWDQNEPLIMRLARVEELVSVTSFPKGILTLAAEGAEFGLHVADLINIDAEKQRLQKSLQKLGHELQQARDRLNNPNFITSAPENVVTETRLNLVKREEQESRLSDALARLESLQ
ncbi:MAG: valine--tRNA ligase [Aestuariivita sp.]|nr:valine--tRNA ligase [Aestuariivita sp.]MCY4347139.1 valine--tRNA ligase [Aestuariivita sp.]